MPTFTWNSVVGATHYYVYAVDDSTGAVIVNNPNVSGTSLTPSTPLTPEHSYTLYVAAESTNSGDIAWSGPRNFTLAALAAPTLSGPGGTIAASSGYDLPTFTWNSIVGANHYYVYAVDDSTGAVIVNNPNVSGTSLTPSTPLTPGHSYTLYVAAESTNNAVITWSSPRNFTLATPPVYAVTGVIYQEYQALRTQLGNPTGNEQSLPGGILVQTFQNGNIYWSAITGVHVVSGSILNQYTAGGGAASSLGLPISDASAAPDGSNNPRNLIQQFVNGTIYAPVQGPSRCG